MVVDGEEFPPHAAAWLRSATSLTRSSAIRDSSPPGVAWRCIGILVRALHRKFPFQVLHCHSIHPCGYLGALCKDRSVLHSSSLVMAEIFARGAHD